MGSFLTVADLQHEMARCHEWPEEILPATDSDLRNDGCAMVR
jgi:hypothetical protein